MRLNFLFQNISILFICLLSTAGCGVTLGNRTAERSAASANNSPSNSPISVSIPPPIPASQLPSIPAYGGPPSPSAVTEETKAGCIVNGNLNNTGVFNNLGSSSLAIQATKRVCANHCNSEMRSLASRSFLYNAGCSYSCKWKGEDIVDRYSSDITCKAGTADPF